MTAALPQASAQATLQQLLPELALPSAQAAITACELTLDSRQVQPGTVFVAYPGEHHDGRDFIEQALAAGASAVLQEADGGRVFDPAAPVIAVPDLQQQLSAIAARFFFQHDNQHDNDQSGTDLHVVGVTGTNGKTTVSQLLAQLFARLKGPAGVVGTLGAGLAGEPLTDLAMTTPDAITCQRVLAQLRERGATTATMEVSSHSLVQGRVNAVPFHTAVFTNLSHDHLDYHGDMTRYAAAKGLLFQLPGLRCAVVNGDDSWGQWLCKRLDPTLSLIRFGVGEDLDVRALSASFGANGIRAQITTPWGDGELVSPLLGEFNLHNLLAVIAAGGAAGLTLADMLAAVPGLQPVPGRMEAVSQQPLVIIDYAHTPDALAKALLAARHHSAGKLWCVFGCGGDRDRGKRPAMAQAAADSADYLVLTSDNPRSESPRAIIDDMLAGVPAGTDALIKADRADAIAWAVHHCAPADTVVIAGKGHEAYQEVAGQRLPFSDHQQVRQALLARTRGESATAVGGRSHSGGDHA